MDVVYLNEFKSAESLLDRRALARDFILNYLIDQCDITDELHKLGMIIDANCIRLAVEILDAVSPKEMGDAFVWFKRSVVTGWSFLTLLFLISDRAPQEFCIIHKFEEIMKVHSNDFDKEYADFPDTKFDSLEDLDIGENHINLLTDLWERVLKANKIKTI